MQISKVAELAYIRIQVPDLDAAERFFNAFGLPTRVRTSDRLYLRSCSTDHHVIVAHQGERRILAPAFEVADLASLRRAADIPGASAIEAIDGPGGGQRVQLIDPDGNTVEIVHGTEKTEPLIVPTQRFNSASERDRRRNTIVRPTHGPSRVLRLGHVVVRSPQVARLANWYAHTLGLLESDDVPMPNGSDDLLMSFLRLDQGDTAVDHHVMQILKGPANHYHHISFEVQDIDDLHVGHEHLSHAGFQCMWGIGRHVQGSQIFDYWLDPFGVMYEHWTDSDMLDASAPKGFTQLDDMHAPWGPAMPQAFLDQGTL